MKNINEVCFAIIGVVAVFLLGMGLIVSVGCSPSAETAGCLGKKAPRIQPYKGNAVINVGDDEDSQDCKVKVGDIVVFRLRVKEALKDKYNWTCSAANCLTPLPVNDLIYEFPKNYLPGDDNYQLLIYRVSRKPEGCSMFSYMPKKSMWSSDSARNIYFHFRERQ